MRANAGSPHWHREHGAAARGTNAAVTTDNKRQSLLMIFSTSLNTGSTQRLARKTRPCHQVKRRVESGEAAGRAE